MADKYGINKYDSLRELKETIEKENEEFYCIECDTLLYGEFGTLVLYCPNTGCGRYGIVTGIGKTMDEMYKKKDRTPVRIKLAKKRMERKD